MKPLPQVMQKAKTITEQQIPVSHRHLLKRDRSPQEPPTKKKTHHNRKGLGDRLEKLFAMCGITAEKYKELKKMAGFPPTCGCPARKEFLNRLPGALAWGFARGGVSGAWTAAVELAKEIRRKYYSAPPSEA